MISTKVANLSSGLKASRGITGVLMLGLAMGLLGSGCSDTESNSGSESTTIVTTTVVAEDVTDIPEGKPVSYDVENWSTEKNLSLNLNNLKQIQNVLGNVADKDDNSLDYASNKATKYRFMKGDLPYLDILDSKQYLEFGWYFANPNDSDKEKEISISHAKKVYKIAQGLMGEEGGKLVNSMLSGQIIKNKEVGGLQIQLAKCEFYSCMLIIRKPNE